MELALSSSSTLFRGSQPCDSVLSPHSGESCSVADTLVLSPFWSSGLRLERYSSQYVFSEKMKKISDSCCFAVIASSLWLFSQESSLVLPHSCQVFAHPVNSPFLLVYLAIHFSSFFFSYLFLVTLLPCPKITFKE